MLIEEFPTAILVCSSDQARIRRQFGSFDYPSQFGNQFFPNQGNNQFFPGQGPQNQFGGPNGVLFPGQNQGQNGFQQGGNQGQGNFQQGGQQGQGNFQQGGQQGGFQQGGQQGGQRQQTTAAPVVTPAPTTLAPQLQRCVDGCIGKPFSYLPCPRGVKHERWLQTC